MARYKRELEARGETLDVHKLIGSPVAGTENRASDFIQLTSAMHRGTIMPSGHPPPTMKWVMPGKAMVGFREQEWIDDKTNYNWSELAADLATNQPTLNQLRIVLTNGTFDFQIDYSHGFDIQLPYTL